MKFTTYPLVASLVTAVSAYTVHNVTVGDMGFTFTPDTITAKTGDYVRFTFESGTHAVAQATYDGPCSPYKDNSDDGTDGLFSGMITYSTTFDVPEYVIHINNTDPIWFYCPEAYHCQSGMTGVINPGKNQNLDTFTSLAEQQSTNTQPSVIVGNTTIGDSDESSSSVAVSSTPSASSALSSAVSGTSTEAASTLATSTVPSSASITTPSTSGSASSSSSAVAATSTAGAAVSSAAVSNIFAVAIAAGIYLLRM
ncbi:Cupredoxin [Kockiozyma suomiensis]|uniref:Cupredoxin n=1 Tax=Kockiozyma suomiensis TaxID=1337062 RepID=UPI0033437BC0